MMADYMNIAIPIMLVWFAISCNAEVSEVTVYRQRVQDLGLRTARSSALFTACTIGGKRYHSGEIFIARNCERMCQCRRTRKFQIITCMPLCPRMRPTTCRQGLVRAIARYVYTFRPLCYCPTTMCVRDRTFVP
ncbi:uncharacterized protein [Clytia hemisphaerica]|uniref:Cnidarian restricted protein n=1 Tax=Clytia hemisphaerica TaxID=252671 RepID=A0A7M5V289_9CNID|eukprot:TCONS_00053611-protein